MFHVEIQYLLKLSVCDINLRKEVWMGYLLKASLHQIFWKHVPMDER